jgi:hypothetical protein
MTFEDFMNEDALTRYRREAAEQEAEFARQRKREERAQQRTQSQQVAPVPASDPELMIYIAPPDWAQSQEALTEALGQVIASERRDFQQALAKRDREIEGLRRELGKLRSVAKHGPIDLPRIPLRSSRRDLRVN